MSIRPQYRFRFWSAATAVYWFVLAWMTHYPDAKALTPDFLEETFADKVFHGAAFTGLAFLIAFAAAAWSEMRNVERGRATKVASLFTLATISLYAVTDEFTQPLTGRTFEVGDLVTDLVGVVCGILIFRALRGFGSPRPGMSGERGRG